MKLVIVLAAVAISASTFAEVDHHRALVDANPSLSEHTCAYLVTREDADGGRRQERFDGAWQLESVNGEAPDQAAVEDYADDAEARERRNAPTSMALAKLIAPGSLELIEETTQGRRFSFEVAPEDGKDAAFLKHMDGSLWATSDYRVTRFHMKNREPMSPSTGVKINHFEQDMRFMWHEGLQGVVLAQMDLKIDGRAFFVKKIEQDMALLFSDIQCQSGL